MYLDNLGLALQDRYARDRDPSDFDRALRLHKQAVARVPAGWLREARIIPAGACYALVMSGNASGAVLALERGRALLLSETLERGRADVRHLADVGYRSLAERYGRAERRLHELTRAGRM
jgi:hypothetical protein